MTDESEKSAPGLGAQRPGGLKDVKDRHGHLIDNHVLRLATGRLTSVSSYQDLLCRLGGDEYLLLVAGGEIDQAVAVAKRMTSVIEDPITIGSLSVQISAPRGIMRLETIDR